MLVLQSAGKPAPSQGRIGLAVAGGGPIGAMYELGALRALEQAIEGFDATRVDAYVGVSSGSFLAAALANGLGTAELIRIVIRGDSHEASFRPQIFLQPAFVEYLRRATRLPGVAWGWWRDLLTDASGSRLGELATRLGALIPTGMFDNAPIEAFLRDALSRNGRSNDFRNLAARLYIVAVDLDSGEAVRFGAPGWDDVPISQAVQASAALPGLYPPVSIRGRQFVDGALRRTMHASVVLDQGVDLLLGIKPLVPFNASRAALPGSPERRRSQGGPPRHSQRLSDAGLPMVLSQTFRTLLQSRAQVGFAKYARQYPATDHLVFEPDEDDGEMFFTNVFSYSSRKRVCDVAFRNTLDDLGRKRRLLAPLLARHGLRLRTGVLDDRAASVMQGIGPAPRRTEATARLERALDEIDARLRG
jgi:predicted acylesterase/phospholipase RssA